VIRFFSQRKRAAYNTSREFPVRLSRSTTTRLPERSFPTKTTAFVFAWSATSVESSIPNAQTPVIFNLWFKYVRRCWRHTLMRDFRRCDTIKHCQVVRWGDCAITRNNDLSFWIFQYNPESIIHCIQKMNDLQPRTGEKFHLAKVKFLTSSKNKTPILGNATTVLGMKLFWVFWLFRELDLCSATSFKRSRRELSIDVA